MANIIVRNPLTSQEHESLEEILKDRLKGRYHHRDGVKDKVDCYCVIYLDEKQPGVIFGQMTGPFGNGAAFKVYRGDNFPRYAVEPETGCKWTLTQLEQQARKMLKAIYRKSIKPSYSGPMSKDGWKGFYQHRSPTLTVGEKGLATMDLAISMGEISLSYKDTMVKIGITMTYENN